MTKKEKQILWTSMAISVFVGIVILTVILLKKKGKLSKRKLSELVVEDLAYWEDLKETDRKGAEKLKEYWSTVGINYSVDQLMSSSFQKQHFWSAVYISNFMKRWGAGSRFKYSARHSDYICEGLKARNDQDKNKIFWSYDPTEVSVSVGDIVGKARETWVTLDNICGGAPTHTDVVYKIQKSGDGFIALVIGGNLSDTVDVKKVTLDKNKKILRPDEYLVVMKNRAI
jgi:hypothetical protein